MHKSNGDAMVPATAQRALCGGNPSKRYLPQCPWGLILTAFVSIPRKFSEWVLFGQVV
jgi:hypothetical protein